jgi:hypothetical protein
MFAECKRVLPTLQLYFLSLSVAKRFISSTANFETKKGTSLFNFYATVRGIQRAGANIIYVSNTFIFPPGDFLTGFTFRFDKNARNCRKVTHHQRPENETIQLTT